MRALWMAFGVVLLGCSRAPGSGPRTGPLFVPDSGEVIGEEVEVIISGDVMGTHFAIHLWGEVGEQDRLAAAGNQAFEEVRRIEALLNMWSEDSALQKWNHSPEAARPMPRELALLVELAVGLHSWTDGALDPSVALALDDLGFYGAPPKVDWNAINSAAQTRWSVALGADRIQVDWPGGAPPLESSPFGDWVESGALITLQTQLAQASATSATVPVQGPMLDLSALAKGYAADRVVQVLEAQGIRAVFVEAGASTLLAFGASALDSLGPQVELPSGTKARKVRIKNSALSTSGQSSLTIGNVIGGASHQFDPRTLAPVDHATEMVVVQARYGWLADALSTALLVMGAEEGQNWCVAHPGLVGGWGFYSIQDGAPLIEWGGSLAE